MAWSLVSDGNFYKAATVVSAKAQNIVRRVIDGFARKYGVGLHVKIQSYATFDALPDSIKASASAESLAGKIKGRFLNGVVYLVEYKHRGLMDFEETSRLLRFD